jgi:hypothetical protein
VRDLVAAGQVEEARALCLAQVDEMMDKINSNAPFRAEYTKLWGQQRKYIVSELLPMSGPPEVRPAAKGAPAARGMPAKPQGAQKAAAIIASVMEETSRVLAEKARMAPPPEPSEEPEEPELEPEASPEPEPAAVAPRLVRPKASVDAAAIKAMSEIPQVSGRRRQPAAAPPAPPASCRRAAARRLAAPAGGPLLGAWRCRAPPAAEAPGAGPRR